MKTFLYLWLTIMLLNISFPTDSIAKPSRPMVTVNVKSAIAVSEANSDMWKYGGGVWQTPTALDWEEKQINSLSKQGIFRASIAWEVLAASKNLDELKVKLNSYALNGFLKRIHAKGAKIIICIDAMPRWLARDNSDRMLADGPAWAKSPPNSYEDWARVIETVVRHFNNNLKLDAYYEIWNEPDWAWLGTTEEYLSLYKASAEGALQADTAVLLGGPALSDWMAFTNIQDEYFIKRFFNFISTTPLPQFNRNRLPLAFLSWHSFYRDPDSIPPAVKLVRNWLFEAGLGSDVALFIDEWNVASEPPYPEGDLNANHVGAAFVVSTLLSMQTAGLDGQVFQMIADPGGDGYTGGTFALSGLPRSNWYSYKILDMLIGQQRQTDTSHKWVKARGFETKDAYFVLISSFMPTNRMAIAALFEDLIVNRPEMLFPLRKMDKEVLVKYVKSGGNLPDGLSPELGLQLTEQRQRWAQYQSEEKLWQQGIDIQLIISDLKSAKSAILYTIDAEQNINPTSLKKAEQAMKLELDTSLKTVAEQFKRLGTSEKLQQLFGEELRQGMNLKQETLKYAANESISLLDALSKIRSGYDTAFKRQSLKIPSEPSGKTFALPKNLQTIKLQLKTPSVQLLVIKKNSK